MAKWTHTLILSVLAIATAEGQDRGVHCARDLTQLHTNPYGDAQVDEKKRATCTMRRLWLQNATQRRRSRSVYPLRLNIGIGWLIIFAWKGFFQSSVLLWDDVEVAQEIPAPSRASPVSGSASYLAEARASIRQSSSRVVNGSAVARSDLYREESTANKGRKEGLGKQGEIRAIERKVEDQFSVLSRNLGCGTAAVARLWDWGRPQNGQSSVASLEVVNPCSVHVPTSATTKHRVNSNFQNPITLSVWLLLSPK
jgi:hypothetical protein